MGGRIAHGYNLGVSCGINGADRLIVTFANHLPISHHQSAHRDFTSSASLSRELKGSCHVKFVGLQ
jgi:hypothetical protein